MLTHITEVPALNKNWVTVHDKCPQINIQLKWHTFSKKKIPNGRTDGRTNERTNGRTNGRTVRLYYAANFIWGHKNKK